MHPSRSRLSVVLLPVLAALAGAPPLLGQAVTSLAQDPVFSFSTVGPHDVTLEVCNSAGCTTRTQAIVVLDPTPVIDSAVVSPLAVEAGRLVKLTASGHGQPPLGFAWKVVPGTSIDGAPIATFAAATAWWDTAGVAPGDYSVQLDLVNGVGTRVSSAAVVVSVVPETGVPFYTVTPCRLFDSRTVAGGGPLVTGAPRTIAVAAGSCGIPAGAKAISANVTAVLPTGQGHMTIYPGNYPRPSTSTVNFNVNQTRANGVILPLASDGTATLAAEAVLTGGGVHLLIDVNGYFE